MCGIISIYNPHYEISEDILKKATNTLHHRGPDAQDYKIYEQGRLGMGHTRLSLVDLSEKANQPLEIGHFSISFNGEIYNYKELRNELLNVGIQFSTTSDTEVIIRSVQHYGLNNALLKFNGCFAFILYDKKDRKLYVVRDRLGEKQLVYTQTPRGEWMFASEVKALLTHPAIKKEPNTDRILQELLFDMYSDPSETFFKGITNFPPGHYFTFDLRSGQQSKHCYWDLNQISLLKYTKKDLPQLIDQVKTILYDAVDLQLQADREVGSILSGGLDSSFITAIANTLSDKKNLGKINCFTAYYDQKLNRDRDNANTLTQASKNLQPHLVEIKPNITIEDVYRLTRVEEAPLYDKTNIAINSIYNAVHQCNIRTVINGQGSDEQWLGYYFVDNFYQLDKKTYTKDRLTKYWLDSCYYETFLKDKKRSLEEIEKNLETNLFKRGAKDPLDNLTYFGMKTHLSYIFRTEDKYSMANSVEVRLPHLDTRLVELSLSIPAYLKIADGREKYLMRKAADKILPQNIIKRKKMGFPNPPSPYDLELAKQAKSINNSKSTILQELINKKSIESNFEGLPQKQKWTLKSIAIFEEVFFS